MVGRSRGKAVVIGAGFAGLSVAALLAKDGYDVQVFEKNSAAGGRAMSFDAHGFRFDMGPSWYLMPDVFDRFFAAFGKRALDYYEIQKLDPAYRVFFRDGSVDVRASLEENLALYDSFERHGGKKLRKHLDRAGLQYDVAMDRFLYRRFDRLTDFLDAKLLASALKIDLFKNLDRILRKQFSSEKARQLLSYTSVFLGTDPRKTPGLYALMAHVDFALGVFYPHGGMVSVVTALERLCAEVGARVQFQSAVNKIAVANGRAHGVQVNGAFVDADVVVSAADYPFTELELLDEQHRTYSERYWLSRSVAPSAFLVYLGLQGRARLLAHHNLILEPDWNRHFDAIFRKPAWPADPCMYICAPSKTDPTVAPSDHENLFVLVPIAPGLPDTPEVRERYWAMIMRNIEARTGEELSSRIVFKRFFTVKDFQSMFNAYRGTALGLAHTLLQTAVFRPSRRSKKVANLYYTGQYAEPGIGVPMTLISSTLTAEAIGHDRS